MSESGTDLLERPIENAELPLIERPEDLLALSREVRELYYPKFAKELAEKDGVRLPKNVKELREGLDNQVKTLASQESEEDRRNIPEIALRHLDKKGWEALGWKEEDKKKVLARLETVLGLGDANARKHALESLVGAGKTPYQALELISEQNFGEQLRAYADLKDSRGGPAFESEADLLLATKAKTLQALGIKTDYIRRFILSKELTNNVLPISGFEKPLQYEFDNELPNNLFDLAWNIGYENKAMFGIDGLYPVLQMQVEVKGTKKEKIIENGVEKEIEVPNVEGRYVVNQGNFMRWMRNQINWWYEEYDTDEVTDYFSKVEIKKGPYYSVNLVTMLFNSNRYFRDEEGHMWKRLYDQTLLEPWMMMNLRQYYLEYEKAMGSEEKLAEAYNSTFFLSKLTRKIYGKSMVNILTTLPEDFNGKDSDTALGEAWSKMFLAYYNMADFEELQKILGAESKFFTREGWNEAIYKVNEGIVKRTGMPVLGKFLGERENDFNAAFDADGKINSKKFTDFVNIFTSPVAPSTFVSVVNQALKDAVEERLYSKEGNLDSKDVNANDLQEGAKVKDSISLDYAWLLAHSWTLFTGTAAKNNFPAVSGHNAETKWIYPQAYRMKYETYGGAGNQYTVPMFKQLSLPLLDGILVENAYEPYKIYDEEDGKLKAKERRKTPMEIMRQMHECSEAYEQIRKDLRNKLERASDENEKKRIQQEIANVDEYEKNEYKIIAGQLEFDKDVMRNYAQNIIGRAKVLYEQVMGAQEIDFDKFTKYDSIFRGVSFNRAEFQKAVQGGLITPLRYLFQANGATQLNMEVRAPVYDGRDAKDKPKWRFESMPLAEAMLGYEVLNIAEFRTHRQEISPARWQEMKKEGYRRRGKYIVRPDGRYLLNADKMQENKDLVYKQWMLMKLGADLWTHIDRHSTDPAYGMDHYMNVLQAIESIPGDIEGDEYNMRKTRITKSFFSKEQIEWLARLSRTTKTALFTKQFFTDIFSGDKRKKEALLGESASIFLSTIFRGY